MSTLTYIAMDLVAILCSVFGLYVPRHNRRDLVVAFLGVNVPVMAVSAALLDSAVTAGLGLGLFGVLSIIRLRSDALPSTRWPTTSARWRSDCSAGSRLARRG